MKKLNKPLLLITLLFFTFGLIMIFSASSIVSIVGNKKEPFYYFIKQLIFLGAGLFASFVVIHIPIKKYKPIYILLVLIALIGSLIFLYITGEFKNNAKSWFDLGFVSIQPSEFAKILLILYYGIFFNKYKNKIKKTMDILWILSPGLIIFVLVALQPDLGTGIIILGICFGIFYSVPINKKYKINVTLLIMVAIITVLGSFVISGGNLLTKTQMNRFQFLEPCKRYQESTGYQVCNGYIAINGGGLTGVGLGNSTQKFLYLPEAHTDFIFPIIVEEIGIIGGVIVIIAYMIVLFLILSIARKANNLTNSIIAYGVAIYMFLHIAINLVGVLGIAPLTGVPLTFLSYGGSFAFSLFIALGLVQRVAIETKESNEDVQRRV